MRYLTLTFAMWLAMMVAMMTPSVARRALGRLPSGALRIAAIGAVIANTLR